MENQKFKSLFTVVAVVSLGLIFSDYSMASLRKSQEQNGQGVSRFLLSRDFLENMDEEKSVINPAWENSVIGNISIREGGLGFRQACKFLGFMCRVEPDFKGRKTIDFKGSELTELAFTEFDNFIEELRSVSTPRAQKFMKKYREEEAKKNQIADWILRDIYEEALIEEAGDQDNVDKAIAILATKKILNKKASELIPIRVSDERVDLVEKAVLFKAAISHNKIDPSVQNRADIIKIHDHVLYEWLVEFIESLREKLLSDKLEALKGEFETRLGVPEKFDALLFELEGLSTFEKLKYLGVNSTVKFTIDWDFKDEDENFKKIIAPWKEFIDSYIDLKEPLKQWAKVKIEIEDLPKTEKEFKKTIHDKLIKIIEDIVRPQVWQAVVRKTFPSELFMAEHAFFSGHKQRLYESLKDRFAITKFKAEILKLEISGNEKNEALKFAGPWLRDEVKKIVDANKNEDSAAVRKMVNDAVSEIVLKLKNELQTTFQSLKIGLEKMDIERSSNDTASKDEADLEEKIIRSVFNPFFSRQLFPVTSIQIDEGSGALIFLENMTTENAGYLPIDDPRVDSLLVKQLKAKQLADIYRKTLLKLLTDNPINLKKREGPCADKAWACVSGFDVKLPDSIAVKEEFVTINLNHLVNLLFPEILYEGEVLDDSKHGMHLESTLDVRRLDLINTEMEKVFMISVKPFQDVFTN